MKRSDLKLLERVFAAEIENCLPYQPHRKSEHHFERLTSEGYLQSMTVTHGAGPFALKINGWQLTQAGRIAYCETC